MVPNEAGTVVLDGRPVNFEVRRSGRARRVRLVVGPEPRVEIVAPYGEPLGAMTDLLQPHRLWIFRHLETIRLAAARPHPSLDRLPYLGGEVRICLETDGNRQVILEDGVLRVCTAKGERPEPIILAWYREEARSVLRRRTEHWSQSLGVRYGRISIRDQRSRWGSCSSLGNLNYSWRLVLAPEEVLDYVVLHEVAHLREANHSTRFWALVEAGCPDYRRHRAWLRVHGPRLAAVLS